MSGIEDAVGIAASTNISNSTIKLAKLLIAEMKQWYQMLRGNVLEIQTKSGICENLSIMFSNKGASNNTYVFKKSETYQYS